MNPLSNLLSVDQVQLNLEASSKKRVFEQAGILFETRLGLARSTIFDSLFAREKPDNTICTTSPGVHQHPGAGMFC
jgi:PTS system nitrogen regulatory IIA component